MKRIKKECEHACHKTGVKKPCSGCFYTRCSWFTLPDPPKKGRHVHHLKHGVYTHGQGECKYCSPKPTKIEKIKTKYIRHLPSPYVEEEDKEYEDSELRELRDKINEIIDLLSH